MMPQTRFSWRGVSVLVFAALAAATLGSGGARAQSDDRYEHRDRDGGYQGDREGSRDWRYEREHDWRRDEWENRHRMYYGEQTYVAPPPPVYYAPPPPPAGLNFFFGGR